MLDGAQRGRHQLVYWDEAHIHQDVDPGHGWGERGKRFFVASSLPGLSAKVSLYGLYLYNEGWVRLWPYARANGEHTVDVLPSCVPRSSMASSSWSGTAPRITAPRRCGPKRPAWASSLRRWLREDVTYHHCHATADDLTRRVGAFEAQVNQDPCAVADRL